MILPVRRCGTLTQAQVRGADYGPGPSTIAVTAIPVRETEMAGPLNHALLTYCRPLPVTMAGHNGISTKPLEPVLLFNPD